MPYAGQNGSIANIPGETPGTLFTEGTRAIAKRALRIDALKEVIETAIDVLTPLAAEGVLPEPFQARSYLGKIFEVHPIATEE